MRINIFNFEKDWNLVEPHLNDPDVVELLNQGMLRFSLRDDKWNHLPLWDTENEHGPWEYTKFDTHDTYAFEKQTEDPEYNVLIDKYYEILTDMGIDLEEDVSLEEFLEPVEDDEDEKIREISKKFDNEIRSIYDKYVPKKNSYRWYQCFGAADYLRDWSKKLAEKTFPNYDWKTYRKYELKTVPGHDYKIDTGCTTTIGKSGNENFLIFDIMLFDNSSIEEILESVGLNKKILQNEHENVEN
ncbi:hypothetical protein [uncultured Desulfosarcina sp.]|uniref:hypothetical protein n=1 Tax=uncultured Desulfosarcina sp. TaxID=218289 RepID=UPI0029C8412E|nr:hypothetical protein [uncultured Desulfosarcina sp.]